MYFHIQGETMKHVELLEPNNLKNRSLFVDPLTITTPMWY